MPQSALPISPFTVGERAQAPRSFKAFRRFNDPDLALVAGRRVRLEPSMAELFPGNGLPARLARALAQRKALPVKELFESFEFFERVRRRLRAPVVADLCCGHGLTGMLFAVFEPTVECVVLVDQRRPDSVDALLDALAEVAPWAPPKIRYDEARTGVAARELQPGASVVAVHACGAQTDRALETAVTLGGSVALMPCCYHRTADRAPRAVRDALPADLATDIDRTYRLEAAGYDVDWTGVPPAITACHRILVGIRR